MRRIVALIMLAAAPLCSAAPPSGVSADEHADLLRGRGMGQARPADAAGVPGPLHVLELADQLQLSDQQRSATQRLYDSMQAEARRLGAAIVEREHALNRLFASGEIDQPQLQSLTKQIAQLRGELRALHLQAHLAQQVLLDPVQLARYRQLRGAPHAGDAHHAPDGHSHR